MDKEKIVFKATEPIQFTPRLSELLSSARALEQSGQYKQAFDVLQKCDELLTSQPADADVKKDVKLGLWRLHPLWWAELQHGGLSLRRCRVQDAGFFLKSYADEQFSSQFNRQRPWRGNLDQALHNSGKLPPIQTGLLTWVVESADGGAIGMASMSNIDTKNRHAEVSVGLLASTSPTLGLKATLMMLHFAMWMMPFNKVYGYIYEDNPQALHNALHLGFLHEGKIADHFFLDGHGFLSVNLVGLTRTQGENNTRLKALAKRVIGKSW